MMLRVMWIAAAVACGGKAPPPQPTPRAAPVADARPAADATPLDQDLPRLVERSLAMYQDVGKAFTASGENCAAATARLHELTGRYRDVVIANAKVLHDGREKELHAALDPHSDAFDAAAAAVVKSPTMARCAPDGAFAKALDELFEAPP